MQGWNRHLQASIDDTRWEGRHCNIAPIAPTNQSDNVVRSRQRLHVWLSLYTHRSGCAMRSQRVSSLYALKILKAQGENIWSRVPCSVHWKLGTLQKHVSKIWSMDTSGALTSSTRNGILPYRGYLSRYVTKLLHGGHCMRFAFEMLLCFKRMNGFKRTLQKARTTKIRQVKTKPTPE